MQAYARRRGPASASEVDECRERIDGLEGQLDRMEERLRSTLDHVQDHCGRVGEGAAREAGRLEGALRALEERVRRTEEDPQRHTLPWWSAAAARPDTAGDVVAITRTSSAADIPAFEALARRTEGAIERLETDLAGVRQELSAAAAASEVSRAGGGLARPWVLDAGVVRQETSAAVAVAEASRAGGRVPRPREAAGRGTGCANVQSTPATARLRGGAERRQATLGELYHELQHLERDAALAGDPAERLLPQQFPRSLSAGAIGVRTPRMRDPRSRRLLHPRCHAHDGLSTRRRHVSGRA